MYILILHIILYNLILYIPTKPLINKIIIKYLDKLSLPPLDIYQENRSFSTKRKIISSHSFKIIVFLQFGQNPHKKWLNPSFWSVKTTTASKAKCV